MFPLRLGPAVSKPCERPLAGSYIVGLFTRPRSTELDYVVLAFQNVTVHSMSELTYLVIPPRTI